MAETAATTGYTKLAGTLTDRANPLALSLYAYQALALLRKGSAFYVREVWRIRGSRTHVKEPTLLSLLEKGLVERLETENHVEFRITAVGCAVYQQNRRYYRWSPQQRPQLPRPLMARKMRKQQPPPPHSLRNNEADQ
jgi:hypothetical protein